MNYEGGFGAGGVEAAGGELGAELVDFELRGHGPGFFHIHFLRGGKGDGKRAEKGDGVFIWFRFGKGQGKSEACEGRRFWGEMFRLCDKLACGRSTILR